MAHGRYLSKLVVTGLVAGVSCFANGDIFPKPYDSERLTQAFQSTAMDASNGLRRQHIQRAIPLDGTRGGNGATPAAVGALHSEPERYVGATAVGRTAASSSYHLIWSQGFLPKFSLMTAALLSLHWSGAAGRIGVFLSQGWHTHLSGRLESVLVATVPNVLLPLLSSSCCLLQLMINALVGAGGCAGFNTILGPIRPFFLSLLAYLNWRARPPLSKGIVRVSLALLPEVLHLWNEWLAIRWQRKGAEKIDRGAILATIEVEIPTMGCVACVNKVDNSLRQSAPGKIVDAMSWINDQEKTAKGGRAKIVMALESREELDSVNESILKSIDDAGFSGSSIVGLDVKDNN